PLLEEMSTHENEHVARGAADGLLRSHGLGNYREQLEALADERGYGSLPLPQRIAIAVYLCDAEIRNGGLSQYFVNSYADAWPDAVAGYESIGAEKKLALLRLAIEQFGNDGPSTNRRRRQNELARLARRRDDPFDDLDQ